MRRSEVAVSKLELYGLSALILFFDNLLGLRPRLLWIAPSALWSIFIYTVISAEGARYISLGRSPRKNAKNRGRAVGLLNWRVLDSLFIREALEGIVWG